MFRVLMLTAVLVVACALVPAVQASMCDWGHAFTAKRVS